MDNSNKRNIRPIDFELWLNHPITKQFLELIKEHRDAPYQYITEAMINVENVTDIDLHKISEFRGNIRTLDLIYNLEDFLEERIKHEEDTTQSNGR